MPRLTNLINKYPYLNALLIMLVMGALSFSLDSWFLPKLGTLMMLQLGVVMVALQGQKIPAVMAAFIGALIFNFFFMEPRYAVHMINGEDIVNMLVFLIVALLTSHLANFYRNQGEALRQVQLRSSILMSVSHDLRTPLSTIIGTLSTMQAYDDKLTIDEQSELLQAALDESHRLHSYIENLLQATKLQHGEMVLQTSYQPLMPVVQSVVKRFDDPRIKLELGHDLPQVHIRESLLEQAIYNVVDNALKYSGQTSPVIIRVASSAKWLEINIIDSGPGIPKPLHQKVFELFYSTRHGDAGEGGTGLGLAVTAGIVKAHQGALDIISTHSGCTMRIRLPAAKKERA
ncbi:ATP-binding protein [Neptunicella sp. SCSIO 80796]|uniref:sensor histidine kinase n=1 Tax=Neptunicella plasticusilytica TaxID=3117012 RepID=UPI003A4DF0CF